MRFVGLLRAISLWYDARPMTLLYAKVLPLVLAQTEAAPAQGQGGPADLLFTYAGPILMFAVIYLLLIRPASRQRKEHLTMLQALKKDDEVFTSGGIVGKIVSIDEKLATLEVADKVKVRVLRDRIAGKWVAAATPKS